MVEENYIFIAWYYRQLGYTLYIFNHSNGSNDQLSILSLGFYIYNGAIPYTALGARIHPTILEARKRLG